MPRRGPFCDDSGTLRYLTIAYSRRSAHDDVTPVSRIAQGATIGVQHRDRLAYFTEEDVMAQFSPEPTHARPRRSQHRGIWAVIAVLLIAVLAGTLWVPFYNRATPAWGGFPFFYWYQLVWVPVVALVSWCAYLLSRIPRGGARGRVPGGPGSGGAPPLPRRVPPREEGN